MAVCFDDLPVELLYKIFHNLSAVDIYFHVSLVNRRLHSIARSYSHFELITCVPQSRKLCTKLSLSQIYSLCLSSTYFDKFFAFHLNRFNHLGSLDLTDISDRCFSQLIDYLSETMSQLSLTLRHITDKNIRFSDERIEHFIRFVLCLKSLRQISLYQPSAILALQSAIPTIEHIYLESITFPELCKVKEYRPNLRYLSVKQLKFNRFVDTKSAGTPPDNIFLSIRRNQIVSQFVEVETNLMKKILFVNLSVYSIDANSSIRTTFSW